MSNKSNCLTGVDTGVEAGEIADSVVIAAAEPPSGQCYARVLDVREATRLYRSGLSARAVGEALGRSHRAVLYAFIRHGVSRRPNGTAHLYPRVTTRCSYCGEAFVK